MARSPWRGDVGQEADCIGAKRDLVELDLRRKIPGFVSVLHRPIDFRKLFCQMIELNKTIDKDRAGINEMTRVGKCKCLYYILSMF